MRICYQVHVYSTTYAMESSVHVEAGCAEHLHKSMGSLS